MSLVKLPGPILDMPSQTRMMWSLCSLLQLACVDFPLFSFQFALDARLGPSASQVGGDADKVAEFVKAVKLVESALKEPWAQRLLNATEPATPTSRRSSESMPPPAVPAKAAEKALQRTESRLVLREPEEAASSPAAAAPAAPAVVNSSTCRAARARQSGRRGMPKHDATVEWNAQGRSFH